MNTAVVDRSVASVRVRAAVERAATILFPLWPLETFIAVNPLGNLSDHPFEEATNLAADSLRCRTHPAESEFAAAYASGRIDDADLRASLLRARSEGRVEFTDERLYDLAATLGALPQGRGSRAESQSQDPVVEEVSRWCAAFLDEGQSIWAMPDRELGLYRCWKQLAEVDRGSRRLGAGDLRSRAQSLSSSPEEAIIEHLQAHGVPDEETVAHLRALLGVCPGWASAIRWRAERTRPANPADLVDLVAITSFYAGALDNAASEQPGFGHTDADASHRDLRLEAYEWHYRDRLLNSIAELSSAPRSTRPDSQAVFCIDARSEGMRRHLEEIGDNETLGFAGFFGLAVSHRPLGSPAGHAQCPVLVAPVASTRERPLPGNEEFAAEWATRRQGEAAGLETFHLVKNDLSSKFALAELAGWALGPLAAARTLAPGAVRAPESLDRTPATEVLTERPSREQAESEAAGMERSALREAAKVVLGRSESRIPDAVMEELRLALVSGREAPQSPAGIGERPWLEFVGEVSRVVGPDAHRSLVEDVGSVGLTPEDAVAWAVVALRMMGLVENFSRLVLLCGHGSRNANNPYGSALDCGACGGNQGGPNARVAAALLNSAEVRAGLRDDGIEIPADTLFVAGLHDTTSDRVEVYDRESVPFTHRADLLRLEGDLERAGSALAGERLGRLPGEASGAAASRRASRRGRDWAQVRPEWGLARNAAFIIGPRSMTTGLDLEARCFMHSYRAEADLDGSGLETILTAPLVVAEWINLQYYFSTVDPERFGAGDKTLHNVVGLHGVQSGAGGDLRIGLPIQAVREGGQLYHEPMRLLAVVEAPLERIDEIVGRNAVLRDMFGGGWAAICARPSSGDPWRRLRRDLRWEPWCPASAYPAPGPNDNNKEDEI